MQCLARIPPEGGSHTGSSGRGVPFRRWLARRLPPRSSRDERGLSSLRSGLLVMLSSPCHRCSTARRCYQRTLKSTRPSGIILVSIGPADRSEPAFGHEPRRSRTRNRGPTGRAARDPHRQALSGENPNAAAAGVARGHERARALNNQLVAGKTPALPAVVLAHERPV